VPICLAHLHVNVARENSHQNRQPVSLIKPEKNQTRCISSPTSWATFRPFSRPQPLPQPPRLARDGPNLRSMRHSRPKNPGAFGRLFQHRRRFQARLGAAESCNRAFCCSHHGRIVYARRRLFSANSMNSQQSPTTIRTLAP
jgi:hypothetical protein